MSAILSMPHCIILFHEGFIDKIKPILSYLTEKIIPREKWYITLIRNLILASLYLGPLFSTAEYFGPFSGQVTLHFIHAQIILHICFCINLIIYSRQLVYCRIVSRQTTLPCMSTLTERSYCFYHIWQGNKMPTKLKCCNDLMVVMKSQNKKLKMLPIKNPRNHSEESNEVSWWL